MYVLAGRIPELYIAALGILKHRSVFCPLFSAFGPEPIRARLTIGRAKVLVTTQSLYERKVKAICQSMPFLEHILLVGDDHKPTFVPGTTDFRRSMEQATDVYTIQPTDPEDPPQVALVGFGKIVERPWSSEGQVVSCPVMTATLSADRRVSDGHRGGLFLAAIDRKLQEPDKL